MEQLHAGQYSGVGDSIWHTTTDNSSKYWSGQGGFRSFDVLFDEALTILRDLMKNHPELIHKPSSLRTAVAEQLLITETDFGIMSEFYDDPGFGG